MERKQKRKPSWVVQVIAAVKKSGGNLLRLRDPEFFKIAAAYAAGLPITIGAAVQDAAATVLQFVDRVIAITMDPSKTLAQLIADGKYNWTNSDIVKLFTLDLPVDAHPREITLFHYNRDMSSDAVLADMERQGFRPATILELLWIGIQHPLLQLDFPIVALGSVVGLDGDRRVAYLRRGDRGRSLSLGWFGLGWYDIYRFAAVRK